MRLIATVLNRIGNHVSRALPSPLIDYFRQSRVALAMADAEGDNHLVLVNAPFCALTGYTPDDVVGRNCRMLQRDAPNIEPRARLREFLDRPTQPNVRTPIVNFRKDGTPFVNLLYMSRLKSIDGQTRYIFASQFDVSRSQPDMLADYDAQLTSTLGRLVPIAGEAGIVVEGTLLTIANSAAIVAQAKMMLADLDSAPDA
ncbi:PAS domain-containing protein [Sphingomonas hankookensis]|uniref:PAS domain-containing protein n=1 Tax=Sphingomonas hankookensis TaxID=563996 RepID=UPI003D302617